MLFLYPPEWIPRRQMFGELGRGSRIVCEILKSGRFLYFTVGLTFCCSERYPVDEELVLRSRVSPFWILRIEAERSLLPRRVGVVGIIRLRFQTIDLYILLLEHIVPGLCRAFIWNSFHHD